MAERTRQEWLVRYLELMGNQRVHGKSRQYIVFENRNKPGRFYYVGKAGALRVGPNLERSASCTDHINMEGIKQWVLEKEAELARIVYEGMAKDLEIARGMFAEQHGGLLGYGTCAADPFSVRSLPGRFICRWAPGTPTGKDVVAQTEGLPTIILPIKFQVLRVEE